MRIAQSIKSLHRRHLGCAAVAQPDSRLKARETSQLISIRLKTGVSSAQIRPAARLFGFKAPTFSNPCAQAVTLAPVDGKEEQESVHTFMALKKLSSVTKRNYMMRIDLYLKHIGKDADTFVRETKKNPKAFEKQFVNFLEEWGKNARPSTIAFVRDSLRRFLEINRVEKVDWKYISNFIPQRRKYGEDRAPTIEEIRRIVDTADLRLRCLVLFLCSSGSRIGAIEWLKWRDIQEVEHDGQKFAKVTVYNGEPERYDTFITPEAYDYLLEYKKVRENLGDKVTPQSHVFLNVGNVDKAKRGDTQSFKPNTVSSMKNLLGRHLRRLGMREVIHEGRNYHSFEFKQAHGFRKFFKTRMEMANVKPIITEMLMGHTLGVSSSYMKPTEKELVEEYAKAIDELTIIKGKEVVTQDSVVATFNKQYLTFAGYSEDEVTALGDLSRLTPEQVQELVKQRQMQSLGLNGNHQKVVQMNEVKDYISQGWDFVTPLPDNEAIVRLPAK